MAPAQPQKPDHFANIANHLVSELKADRIPWRQSVQPVLPINGINGRRMNAFDTLNLADSSSCADGDPRFISFKEAKANNWKVIAGSHAAYRYSQNELEVTRKADNSPVTVTELSSYPVFHASQISGMPPYEAKQQQWQTPVAIQAILRTPVPAPTGSQRANPVLHAIALDMSKVLLAAELGIQPEKSTLNAEAAARCLGENKRNFMYAATAARKIADTRISAVSPEFAAHLASEKAAYSETTAAREADAAADLADEAKTQRAIRLLTTDRNAFAALPGEMRRDYAELVEQHAAANPDDVKAARAITNLETLRSEHAARHHVPAPVEPTAPAGPGM